MPCDFALLIGYNGEEWGNLGRKKNLRSLTSFRRDEILQFGGLDALKVGSFGKDKMRA